MREIIFNNILPNVQKPARYSGGEYNIRKMKETATINFALAFPDSYEVGMSHLGMKILYSLLNDMPEVNCERMFAPMNDMLEEMKKNSIPLYGLESFRAMRDFDFIGFSLQYEMCLTTVLYMLEAGGVSLTAKERGNDEPLVIAGGPCCVNPEPFCEIFDLIVIGEAEETLPKLIELYATSENKQEFLLKAASLQGIYVPALYTEEYGADGKTNVHRAINEKIPEKIERVFIKDLDNAYFPEKIIIPYIEIVHDRIMQEVMRGCPRGCRFCQAGSIYRPVRFKKPETICKQALKLIENTGYEEISLSSLSTTDYPALDEVITGITESAIGKNTSVSLPSLRIDKFSVDTMKKIQKMRLGTLTFAPEAGSQRMRDIINKNVSEEDIFQTLTKAFENGFTKIKLYFMIGLPYETDEDVREIARLANRIFELGNGKNAKGRFSLSISVANFVPKPFTPFQFVGQNDAAEFTRKHELIRRELRKSIKYAYHDSSVSVIEAAFARGDRKLNKVLLSAFKNGCVFDSWQDRYCEEGWLKAFEENLLSPYDYAERNFTYTDVLPWDFIDNGVSKEFYIRENENSIAGKTTPSCYEKCSLCGINEKNGRCAFEI